MRNLPQIWYGDLQWSQWLVLVGSEAAQFPPQRSHVARKLQKVTFYRKAKRFASWALNATNRPRTINYGMRVKTSYTGK